MVFNFAFPSSLAVCFSRTWMPFSFVSRHRCGFTLMPLFTSVILIRHTIIESKFHCGHLNSGCFSKSQADRSWQFVPIRLSYSSRSAFHTYINIATHFPYTQAATRYVHPLIGRCFSVQLITSSLSYIIVGVPTGMSRGAGLGDGNPRPRARLTVIELVRKIGLTQSSSSFKLLRQGHNTYGFTTFNSEADQST